MNVLELFAGSRSIGIVAEQMGMNVFSSDIMPFKDINYVTDILNFDCNNIPYPIDIVWASPPCTYFSVASIGYHWNKNNTPKSKNALLGISIVEKTLEIIRIIKPKFFFIENPRGKLRKLPIMLNLPRTTIMYCQYGDNRMKPTDLWSNNLYSLENPNGFISKTCYNNRIKCHHESAPRGSKTGTQGLIDAYQRSKIPNELCYKILESCINSNQ